MFNEHEIWEWEIVQAPSSHLQHENLFAQNN